MVVRYLIFQECWKCCNVCMHDINRLTFPHSLSTNYDGYVAPSTALLHDRVCNILYCSESIDFIIWQAGICTRLVPWCQYTDATCYIRRLQHVQLMIHPARWSPIECKNHVRDLLAIELPLNYVATQAPSSSLFMPSMFLAYVNSIDLVKQTGFDKPPATYT